MKKKTIVKLLILLVGDFIVLYGAMLLSLWVRYYPEMDPGLLKQHHLPFSLVFIIWIVVFGSFGLYELGFMKNNQRFFYRILNAIITNLLLTAIILYFVPYFEIEPRRNLILIGVFSAAAITFWRFGFNFLVVRTPGWKVIFWGINKEVLELTDYLLKNPQLGQKPVALMQAGQEERTKHLPLHFGDQKSLLEVASGKNIVDAVHDLGIDTIVITREIKENKDLIQMLFQVIPLGVSTTEFTAYHEMFTGKIPMSLIGEVWFLENLVGSKKGTYEFFKRALDILIASLLSVPSAVLFPLIALLIKLESEGPIFFKQERVGKNGKRFRLAKFRSMVKNADKLSGLKGGKDERHTRTGGFLRKSYLDELPQIINVFKGEMSFIGPRPERPEYVEGLKQKIPFYEMRLLVPPGITGWAQINMEDDASVEDAPEKIQYDLYYIKNRSLALDLLIALKTLFIISRRGGK